LGGLALDQAKEAAGQQVEAIQKQPLASSKVSRDAISRERIIKMREEINRSKEKLLKLGDYL
jgi:hypothetical protein